MFSLFLTALSTLRYVVRVMRAVATLGFAAKKLGF